MIDLKQTNEKKDIISDTNPLGTVVRACGQLDLLGHLSDK